MLIELAEIHQEIEAIQVYENGNCSGTPITVKDLCYAPIPSKGCLVETPIQYWQMDINKLKAAKDVSNFIYKCV